MTQLAKEILGFLIKESQNGKFYFEPFDVRVSQNVSFISICNALDELEHYGYIRIKKNIIGSFYFTP